MNNKVPAELSRALINDMRRTLSIDAIAKRAGISKGTIDFIMNARRGQQETRVDTYNKLLRVYQDFVHPVLHFGQQTCGDPSVERHLKGCRCHDCKYLAHREHEKRELLKRKAEKSKGTFRTW